MVTLLGNVIAYVRRSNWLKRLHKDKRANKPVSLHGNFGTSRSVSIRASTIRTNTIENTFMSRDFLVSV